MRQTTIEKQTDSIPTNTVAVGSKNNNHLQAIGTAAVTPDSKPLAKHLVLVSKPVYMGVYVAIDAESDADAVSKLQERIDDDNDDISERLTDLFGEIRVMAHSAVNEEYKGYVNAADDFDYELPRGEGDYHGQMDMTCVVNPVAIDKIANYHGVSVDDLPAIDLTNEQEIETV
jgi:hypothetical protein